jgi:serine/threonine-protein kinase BUR1
MLTSLVFSEVHRARSKKNNAAVALKKIIMHHEKDGVCAFRRPYESFKSLL